MKIIFWDYDGTIVDTETWYKKIIVSFLKKINVFLKEDIEDEYFYKFISGKHNEDFMEKLKEDSYIKQDTEIDPLDLKKYYTEFIKNLKIGNIKIIDNIDKTIEKLSKEKNIIMCITSSSFVHDFIIKSSNTNNKILNDLFKIGENIYLCGNIENCQFKPAPDVYLYALNDIKHKYNLHLTKKDELFIVEDSNAGCTAALSFKNKLKNLNIKIVRFVFNDLIDIINDKQTDFVAKNSTELYNILKNKQK